MEVPDFSSLLGAFPTKGPFAPSVKPAAKRFGRAAGSVGLSSSTVLSLSVCFLLAQVALAEPASVARGSMPGKEATPAREVAPQKSPALASLPVAKQLLRPGAGRVTGGESFALRLGSGRRRAGFVVSYDAVDGLLQAGTGGGLESQKLPAVGAPPADLGPALRVPESVRGQPVEYEWLGLTGGERVLVLTFGKEPVYQVLLLGAAPGESEPQLSLKGLVGPSAAGIVELSRIGKAGEQTLLLTRSPPGPNLCGRTVPTSVQKLDPAEGQFVRVAIPALGVTERKGALELSAEPLESLREAGPGGVDETRSSAPGEVASTGTGGPGHDAASAPALEVSLAPLGAPTPPGLGWRWLDGRRDEVAPPHSSSELTRLSGHPFRGLVVHARRDDGGGPGPGGAGASDAAASDGRELFILTEKQVFSVRLPKAETSRVFVPLPEGLGGGCLAVAQGSVAWVSEVTAVVGAPVGLTSLQGFVRGLDRSSGELAARAVVALGPGANSRLTAEVRRLGPLGRRRGEQIAQAWGGRSAATYEAQLVAVGSEDEARRAKEYLRLAGDVGLQELASALKDARPTEEVRLAEAIAELAPTHAPEILVRQLDQPAAARRLEIRKVLARVCKDPDALRAAEAVLADTHHSRRSRSELLRALSPHMAKLQPESRKAALAQLETARFHEAYRLTPVLLALAELEEEPKQLAAKWLDGSAPRLLPKERAALRVQLFSVALDQGVGEAFLTGQAARLLANDERRVREVSARYLQEFPGSRAGEPLAVRAKADDWPEVRSQALLALAELRRQAEPAAAAEEAILRALRRDTDASVRAAAAHALDRAPTEQSAKALRRALGRDDANLVRAEAARSLGFICDQESLEPLTQIAQAMRHGVADEADVRLGLEAAAAVARLSPPDLDHRLEPLLSPDVPGALRVRVEQAISPARGMCATQPAQ